MCINIFSKFQAILFRKEENILKIVLVGLFPAGSYVENLTGIIWTDMKASNFRHKLWEKSNACAWNYRQSQKVFKHSSLMRSEWQLVSFVRTFFSDVGYFVELIWSEDEWLSVSCILSRTNAPNKAGPASSLKKRSDKSQI